MVDGKIVITEQGTHSTGLLGQIKTTQVVIDSPILNQNTEENLVLDTNSGDLLPEMLQSVKSNQMLQLILDQA